MQEASWSRSLKLALLSMCATSAIVVPGEAYAQEAAPAAQSSYNFNIPSQPLARSLSQIAERSNIQVIYPDKEPNDLVAPAVVGSMTVAQALATALAGSPYTFSFVRPGVVTLVRAGGDGVSGERVLGAVRVQGSDGGGSLLAGATPVNGVNGSRDVTATEGTGSYTSNALTVGSKVAASIKDTPKAVSVITSQQIQDRNITDLGSAMRDTPGVTVLPSSATDSEFYSRGFAITQIQIDGGPPRSTRAADPSPENVGRPIIDMSLYDHVELVRGATGTFNAYGDPGGVINLVRKRPLDHTQMLIEFQGGSWGWHRVSADVTGPIAFDGKLRARLIATHQDNDYFYKVVHTERDLVSGTLEYDLTSTTLMSFGFNYARQNGTAWSNGLPRFYDGRPTGLPRSTSLTIPSALDNSSSLDVFGQLEQKIGPNWNLRLKGTRSDQRYVQDQGVGVASVGGVDPVTHAGAYLTVPTLRYRGNPRQTQIEATLDGKFRLFGQDQKILIGASYSMGDWGKTSYFQASSATFVGKPKPPVGSLIGYGVDVFAFDPYSWTPQADAYITPTAGFDYADNRVLNAYANFELTPFKRLHIDTSLRYSATRTRALSWIYCRQRNMDLGRCSPIGSKYYPGSDAGGTGGALSEGHDFSWPPSVSVRYDMGKRLTLYAAYSDIYQNRSTQLDINRKPLPPVTGMNFEGGVKWLSRSEKLNANLSVYYTRQNRTAIYSVCDDDPATAAPDCTFPTINVTGLAPQTFCCSAVDPQSYNLSYGVDLEISGEIRRGWQISASYTYNINRNESPNAKYFDGSTQALQSQSPKNLFKIWSTYEFGDESLFRGIRFGVGANGQSQTFVQTTRCTAYSTRPDGTPYFCLSGVNVFFTDPGHVVVDASLGYKISGGLRVDAEFENLLDKTYYARIGNLSNSNWYGAPRSAKVTLRAKF